MKIARFVLLFGILLGQVAAQTSKPESFQKLSESLSSGTTIDFIKQKLSEAKKIAQNNEKAAGGDRQIVADTLMEYVSFRKKVFQILEDIRRTRGASSAELTEAYLQYHENAREIRGLLLEIIKIHETELKTESVGLARAKYELAWLSDKYTPQSFGPTGWKERLERSNDTQNLYAAALGLQAKLLSSDADDLLLTAFFLANSYSQSADYEKALPLYEKYIAGIEKKYGVKSEALIPALEMRAGILRTIGDDAAAGEAVKRIRMLSGGNEAVDWFINLTPRARSFKYDGINEKGGRVSIETVTKIARASNGTEAYAVNSSSVANSVMVGGFAVVVSVDESGKVTEAEALTDERKLKEKIEKNVRAWEFRPFIYEGKPRRMKGVVYYWN